MIGSKAWCIHQFFLHREKIQGAFNAALEECDGDSTKLYFGGKNSREKPVWSKMAGTLNADPDFPLTVTARYLVAFYTPLRGKVVKKEEEEEEEDEEEEDEEDEEEGGGGGGRRKRRSRER